MVLLVSSYSHAEILIGVSKLKLCIALVDHAMKFFFKMCVCTWFTSKIARAQKSCTYKYMYMGRESCA